MKVTVSNEELVEHKLSEAHLQQTVDSIHNDGYVVLENVVPHHKLDLLRQKMLEDLQTLISAKEKFMPINFVKGHIQQDAPTYAPYIFRELVANPFVTQVTHKVLGAGLYNSYFSGNTNLPGSGTQPVHVDSGQLWENLRVAHPIFSLVVNVAPLEVNEENGSIELWPGSHSDISVSRYDDIKVDLKCVKARREFSPPVRGNTKKGAVLIRDNRLWHRGMPNYSNTPRQMVAMVHYVSWYRTSRKLQFEKGCESAFENEYLDSNAEFIDEPIDYIFRNHPYDYNEESNQVYDE